MKAHLDARLPNTMAGRYELLLDLYAPHDEDGIRRPGTGMISLEDFNALLCAPSPTSARPSDE